MVCALFVCLFVTTKKIQVIIINTNNLLNRLDASLDFVQNSTDRLQICARSLYELS